jgi:Domain of unknown function (DUF892)
MSINAAARSASCFRSVMLTRPSRILTMPLSRVLPRLSKAVQADSLREMLDRRLEEGGRIISDIESVLEELDESPGRKKNIAAEGLINDAPAGARNSAPACTDHTNAPRRMLLWHANYHPDGGQLFFPQQREPFYVPLALPGDDVTPERFVCFRFDGRRGLYIHPNIWHEGVFALRGTQRFFDRQSAVHARVSVDFAREFGCLVEAPIPE